MAQEILRQERHPSSFDFFYLWRCICRYLAVILMCAGICGICSYILLDIYLPKTFTASTNMAVVPRDNSAMKQNDYNMNAAVARYVSVMNSDALKDQMRKQEEAEVPAGSIQAVQIGSSNMITLKASAESSSEAFRLLGTALKAYPSLSSYFESGYLLKSLEPPSVDVIVAKKSKAAYYAVIVFVLTAAAGCGAAACVCLFGDKVHSRIQALDVLDTDFLGGLPYLKKRGQKAILISGSVAGMGYIEEVDKLTTKIQSKMDREQMKSLMVVSVKENEGKSTVAANLALNLARRGKKVLLIDADLRRPAMSKIFNKTVSEERELSSYLKGKTELKKVVCRERSLGFFYAFQNKPLAEPDKLLEGHTFQALMEESREKMDYIILDTPPVGAVRDAEAMAGFCDGALIVMRQDRVGAAMVNDAVDSLEEAGTSVAGCVLNAERSSSLARAKRRQSSIYYNDKN